MTKNTLRRWREANALSLDEVSGLTGISVSELSRLERGLRSLPPLRRVDVARRLGVRLRDLFPPERAASR